MTIPETLNLHDGKVDHDDKYSDAFYVIALRRKDGRVVLRQSYSYYFGNFALCDLDQCFKRIAECTIVNGKATTTEGSNWRMADGSFQTEIDVTAALPLFEELPVYEKITTTELPF